MFMAEEGPSLHHLSFKGIFLLLEPFEVGFVETVYTVPESVGSVEVCVILTKPQFNILEEFIIVEVTDFPSSVYIPADVALASEPVYMHVVLVSP